MLRKHKRYSRPKKPYDKQRIEGENELVKMYGLKNKREIWKAKSKIDSLRRRAKNLITASRQEQEKLFKKMGKIGFPASEISDILSLTAEDLLKRRLQSVVVRKGLVKTPKQARQLIVHKHIIIGKRIVNVPSYIVSIDEEDQIKLVEKNRKIPPVLAKKEAEGEVKNEGGDNESEESQKINENEGEENGEN
jgi:small subunit ribosomal protein S4